MTPSARYSVASAQQRVARAEIIKEAWRAGRQSPDAAAALRENPEIAADRAVALDLAYEEFCSREEAGERPDSAAFCAQFSFGTSLRRLLTLHRFLDDNPQALNNTPASWPAPGKTVADFLIVRELGRGGFARVYLALETTAGSRPVALKVSAGGSREADTLGPLSHPHLIQVLSSRPAEEWTVVAMPFAGTATLEDALSSAWPPAGGLPPRSAGVLLEAASSGRQKDDPPFHSHSDFAIPAEVSYEAGVVALAARLFTAVAYLHEKGVAHRDLKPSNVLLGPTGHPYLLDFNLATQTNDPWRLAGTLPYMAPEQLALILDPAQKPPGDWRPADVFAGGVILFELLTGRHPFSDSASQSANARQDEAAAALRAAQQGGHRKINELNPCVRRAVRSAVERCLASDPGDRPSAAELAALFTRLAAPPRSRWRFALPALCVAAAAATLLAFAPWRKPAQAEPPQPPPPPVAAPQPSYPTDPFERGKMLYRQRDYLMAGSAFAEAAEKKQDGLAHACTALCAAIRREYRVAIGHSNMAIKFGYREPGFLANRAFNLHQIGQYQEALDNCNEALDHDPTLRAARLTRALTHLQLKMVKGRPIPEEAMLDIEEILAGSPNTDVVWMLAAQLYVLAPNSGPEMHDKAAKSVREAVLVGKDPTFLGTDPTLRVLAGHPIFQEALNLGKRPRFEPPLNPYLVDIVPK